MRALADLGATASFCTGSPVTLIVMAPTAVPDFAWIVAEPGAIPVTTPASSTVAKDGFSDFHSTTFSWRGSPFSVRGVAASLSTPPTTTGRPGGSISMRATSIGNTLMRRYAGFPLITAPTVDRPGAKKLTVPVSSTKPTSPGTANQVEGLALIGFPASSLATAVNFILSPTWASVTRGMISIEAGTSAFGSAVVPCDQAKQLNANTHDAVIKILTLCITRFL